MSDHPTAPPPGARTSTLRHRIPFYDTDAMGVVHHANYVHYLELSRILFLDQHDVPYREYVASDLHFAVTELELRYQRGARFDDVIEVTVWTEQVRGASLRMAYVVACNGEILATALTGHAMVNGAGRPRRIPKERRDHLLSLVASAASG